MSELNGYEEYGLEYGIVEAIIRVGRAQERVKDLLQEDIFERLSKHNPEWDSEYDKEAEVLENVRLKLCQIHDNLCTIMGILQPEGE